MRSNLSRIVCAAFTVALCVSSSLARADYLIAGGVRLDGKVKSINAKGVEFEPSFAKGAFFVAWDKVQDISTEARQQVLYGDDQEVDAQVTGYRDGKLRIGDAEVEPAALVSCTALAEETPGFLDRTRASWRYWHGSVDVGFNLQRATDDQLGAMIALHALRSRERTRLILGADYRYSEERQSDSAPPRKRVTKDSAAGLVRGEYDFTKSVYGYASTDLLYDSIQNLSLRAVPKAGAGYTVWQREPKEGLRDFFQLEAGAGWVYEKYMNDCSDPALGCPPANVVSDDDYFTIAFGAAAAYLLPLGAAFDWRFDYLPAVDDWGDYVVRSSAGLMIPLIAPLSAHLSIADTYDSTPSGNADENSLLFDTTLNIAW